MLALDNLLYLVALLVLGVLLSALVGPARRTVTRTNLVLFFGISFVARCLLVIFNESIHLFAPKKAGNTALDLYRSTNGLSENVELLFTDKFGIQTLINVPAFTFFGGDRTNLLFTNAFLGALAGILAFAYLYRYYNLKAAYWGLVLISIFPAAVNFSMFGLRDIVIYFFAVSYIGTLIFVTKRPLLSGWGPFNLGVLGISLYALTVLRPANFAVALTMPLLFLIYYLYGELKKVRNRASQALVLVVFALSATALMLSVGSYFYDIALATMGVPTDVAPWEVADVYAEQRFARAAGGAYGGRSHILPPSVYNSLNPLARIPIQTVGLIVLPYPWLLTKLSRILAFFDSVFVMYCLWLLVRKRKQLKFWARSDRLLWLFLIASFAVAIMGLGLVVNNAGNGFRMRFSVAPFLLMPTAILLGNLPNRRHPFSARHQRQLS